MRRRHRPGSIGHHLSKRGTVMRGCKFALGHPEGALLEGSPVGFNLNTCRSGSFVCSSPSAVAVSKDVFHGDHASILFVNLGSKSVDQVVAKVRHREFWPSRLSTMLPPRPGKLPNFLTERPWRARLGHGLTRARRCLAVRFLASLESTGLVGGRAAGLASRNKAMAMQAAKSPNSRVAKGLSAQPVCGGQRSAQQSGGQRRWHCHRSSQQGRVSSPRYPVRSVRHRHPSARHCKCEVYSLRSPAGHMLGRHPGWHCHPGSQQSRSSSHCHPSSPQSRLNSRGEDLGVLAQVGRRCHGGHLQDICGGDILQLNKQGDMQGGIVIQVLNRVTRARIVIQVLNRVA
eukprot:6491648-Amphidinium_carterae.1